MVTSLHCAPASTTIVAGLIRRSKNEQLVRFVAAAYVNRAANVSAQFNVKLGSQRRRTATIAGQFHTSSKFIEGMPEDRDHSEAGASFVE